MFAAHVLYQSEPHGLTTHRPREHHDAASATPAASLDEIYDAHFDFVWRSLRAMGVPAASIDDAAQDVFVVVHRKLADFEGRSSVKTWLFAIAYRVARDHRRSLRRRGDSEEIDEAATPSTHPSPLEHAERAEAARLLERFLDTLDEGKRAAFVLSELEQLTAPEIATALDTNVNTVYARVRKARQLFVEAVHAERERDAGGAR